jgi:hypothetical protein
MAQSEIAPETAIEVLNGLPIVDRTAAAVRGLATYETMVGSIVDSLVNAPPDSITVDQNCTHH